LFLSLLSVRMQSHSTEIQLPEKAAICYFS
jgi:hypothetical protein